ncbi:hypothetical protein [Phytoactinopolyspora limicola]|uniref:hypothetical protein n=1 Tax=Phytoactinopolyspora limicola TaxID=2715536 RepID=UPI001408DE20|nr:hypothetical protein [Phytoactinopolyspora limicola]
MNTLAPGAAKEATPASAEIDPVTLTSAELLALLELRPGPEAELSRQRLQLPNTGIDDLSDAGVASLVARDMFEVGGEQSGPVGAASVAGYAITAATRWTSVAFVEEDTALVTLVVESPEVTLLVTPRPPGLFDLVPLRQGVRAVDMFAPSVARFAERDEARHVEIVVTTDATERVVRLTADPGSWRVTGPDDDESRVIGLDEIPDLLSGVV